MRLKVDITIGKRPHLKIVWLNVHAKSETHVNAMISWAEHKRMALNNTSVLGMMEGENQNYIKNLAEVLLVTGTQNIAQRGHDETETSKNRGNFLEILSLVGEHDPF